MQQKKIIVGVTGGIAAYKTADLVSKLVQADASVAVVMTEGAKKFVGPTTFEALTGQRVYSSMFDPVENFRGEHIGLAEWADLLVVAPATAHYMAQVAHGMADNLLATLALSCTCPMLLAPAMNTDMWDKAAVKRNVAQLVEDGKQLIEPGSGWLSCGRVGAGRMAEPAEILTRIGEVLA